MKDGRVTRPSFFWYDNDSGHKGPFRVTQPNTPKESQAARPSVSFCEGILQQLVTERCCLNAWI